MKCPFCGNAETQVIETRLSEDGCFVRRRRRCSSCDKRFTTYERPEVSFPIVVKKDGRRIEYDPAKLRASLMLALRTRPVSAEAVDAALNRIARELLTRGQREVSTEDIGELVMRELHQLDQIAYVRFASVYRSFEDVEEFATAMRELKSP